MASRIQGLLFWLFKGGSFEGNIDIEVEVDVDVDMDSYFGCLTGVSKSVQVLFHGIEAVIVLVLTLIILKMASPVATSRLVPYS